jgi:hypothetical protein
MVGPHSVASMPWRCLSRHNGSASCQSSSPTETDSESRSTGHAVDVGPRRTCMRSGLAMGSAGARSASGGMNGGYVHQHVARRMDARPLDQCASIELSSFAAQPPTDDSHQVRIRPIGDIHGSDLVVAKRPLGPDQGHPKEPAARATWPIRQCAGARHAGRLHARAGPSPLRAHRSEAMP